MHKEIVEKIKKYAEKNKDGFTVAIVNGKMIKAVPRKGYVVSLTDNATIEMLKDLPHNFNGIIGGWYNQDNGKYYIDINVLTDDMFTATILATIFYQKAIFDLKRGKTIFINKTDRKKAISFLFEYNIDAIMG